VLEDEKATTATALLRRAVAHFRAYGAQVERVMTDNGSAYGSLVHRLACKTLGLNDVLPDREHVRGGEGACGASVDGARIPRASVRSAIPTTSPPVCERGGARPARRRPRLCLPAAEGAHRHEPEREHRCASTRLVIESVLPNLKEQMRLAS